jgi:hypothetical protein
MNPLGKVCAAIIGCVSAFATGEVRVQADLLAKVTVTADGPPPVLRSMSSEGVRGVARDDARRNAIEQTVGHLAP